MQTIKEIATGDCLLRQRPRFPISASIIGQHARFSISATKVRRGDSILSAGAIVSAHFEFVESAAADWERRLPAGFSAAIALFRRRYSILTACAMALSMTVCAGFQIGSNSTTAILIFSQPAMAQEEPDVDAESDDLTPQPKDGGQSKETSKDSPKAEESKPPRPQIVDTSIEEKPAVSQPAATEEKSDEYKEREAKLAEPLKKLIQAPYLFNNAKGGSSELTDAFVAAAKLGPKLKDDLQFIIENGSPAGKLYAACLIRTFDAPTGTRILTGFKADKTMVNNKTYTSQEHYTAGEVVTDLLSPTPTILLRPR